MTSTSNGAPGSPIGTVERETGLSADTLRVWERRYGFPAPARDRNGERVYPQDQVEKLRVIRRLIDRGFRPGKIVRSSLEDLRSRVGEAREQGEVCGDVQAVHEALHLLKSNRLAELRERLAVTALRLGVQRFAIELIEPLNIAVGNAWARGEIGVSEEHLYTEQVQHLLRQAIGSAAQLGQKPTVLLTTLPGEEHQLGLLMAHACLTVEGARCISLGVQTPASEIVRAAGAHRADIVGLSFSQAIKVRSACAMLAELRERVAPTVEIWAGGSIWALSRKSVPAVTTIASLTGIAAAVAAWRTRAAMATTERGTDTRRRAQPKGGDSKPVDK